MLRYGLDKEVIIFHANLSENLCNKNKEDILIHFDYRDRTFYWNYCLKSLVNDINGVANHWEMAKFLRVLSGRPNKINHFNYFSLYKILSNWLSCREKWFTIHCICIWMKKKVLYIFICLSANSIISYVSTGIGLEEIAKLEAMIIIIRRPRGKNRKIRANRLKKIANI